MQFSLDNLDCMAPGFNLTCPRTIASPDVTGYQVIVFDWGTSPAGTIELSDNCGGTFGTSLRLVGSRSGVWLPPVGGGICLVTARATNGDGLFTEFSLAVVVAPGTPLQGPPPSIFMTLNSASLDSQCLLSDSTSPRDCGLVSPGATMSLSGNITWGTFPGSFTFFDDCSGLPQLPFFIEQWVVPDEGGRICTTTVSATNVSGETSEVAAHYEIRTSP